MKSYAWVKININGNLVYHLIREDYKLVPNSVDGEGSFRRELISNVQAVAVSYEGRLLSSTVVPCSDRFDQVEVIGLPKAIRVYAFSDAEAILKLRDRIAVLVMHINEGLKFS